MIKTFNISLVCSAVELDQKMNCNILSIKFAWSDMMSRDLGGTGEELRGRQVTSTSAST